MDSRHIGNLFVLAEQQILYEISQGIRPIKKFTYKQKGREKEFPYSFKDIIDYAVIIRKQLDRYGKTGQIYKVKNIHTKKLIEIESKKERRHRKYLKERILK